MTGEVNVLSLRDPDAAIHFRGGRVFRVVRPHAVPHFNEMIQREVIRDLMRRGTLIETRPVESGSLPEDLRSDAGNVFEHELVPFVSHPSEWSPAMLADAARCTLELALELAPHGMMLKDATASNVQFVAANPVFVDVPSIVRRETGTFIWKAQQQFLACFTLPLIANDQAGVPIRWLTQDTFSGVSQEQVARILGARAWRGRLMIRSVGLPALIGRNASKRRTPHLERILTNDQQARYVLERQFRSLERDIARLRHRVSGHGSHWREYADSRAHYSSQELFAKREFVKESVSIANPRWTLDVGSNTGEFSELAAGAGDVVAIDSDETSVSGMFDFVQRKKLRVLPLVVDLASPTPARGWCNSEQSSFIQRAESRFDLVLLLAVIHHLRVSSGIPIARVLNLVARLARQYVVIEWVPMTDPMFVQIARGREAIYDDYDKGNFEALLQQDFVLHRALELTNGRVLYFAEKRRAVGR